MPPPYSTHHYRTKPPDLSRHTPSGVAEQGGSTTKMMTINLEWIHLGRGGGLPSHGQTLEDG